MEGVDGVAVVVGVVYRKKLIVSPPELNPLLDHIAARLVKIKKWHFIQNLQTDF